MKKNPYELKDLFRIFVQTKLGTDHK